MLDTSTSFGPARALTRPDMHDRRSSIETVCPPRVADRLMAGAGAQLGRQAGQIVLHGLRLQRKALGSFGIAPGRSGSRNEHRESPQDSAVRPDHRGSASPRRACGLADPGRAQRHRHRVHHGDFGAHRGALARVAALTARSSAQTNSGTRRQAIASSNSQSCCSAPRS